jgi:hypothetical protein
MSRRIGVRAIVNGQPQYLDGLVAVALGERVADRGRIVVGGCGMDMGFEIAYRLGHALYPDGFRCTGKHCPSNDHANGQPCDVKPRPVHIDGGYALSHRWL